MMPSLNHRRDFLANLGMGFGGLALGSLLAEEGIVKGSDTHVPDGRAHHPARGQDWRRTT